MSESSLNRIQAPALKSITDFAMKQVEIISLDNGIPVYVLDAGVEDVLKVEFIFRNPAFNPTQPLLHSAANKLLSEGTSRYNSRQLAEMVDYYGAHYETEQSQDISSVVLYTLTRHLENTLPVIG